MELFMLAHVFSISVFLATHGCTKMHFPTANVTKSLIPKHWRNCNLYITEEGEGGFDECEFKWFWQINMLNSLVHILSHDEWRGEERRRSRSRRGWRGRFCCSFFGEYKEMPSAQWFLCIYLSLKLSLYSSQNYLSQ